MKQKHQKHGLDCKDALLFHMLCSKLYFLSFFENPLSFWGTFSGLSNNLLRDIHRAVPKPLRYWIYVSLV